jgi:hypothetical protein
MNVIKLATINKGLNAIINMNTNDDAPNVKADILFNFFILILI